MTVYSELIEEALARNRTLIKRLETNKEYFVEINKAKMEWLSNGNDERKFEVKLDLFGTFDIDIYMSEEDTIKDVYILLDETIWKIEIEYRENINGNHISYYNSTFDLTIHPSKIGKCRIEKRIKAIKREYVPATTKEDIEYDYKIVCD